MVPAVASSNPVVHLHESPAAKPIPAEIWRPRGFGKVPWCRGGPGAEPSVQALGPGRKHSGNESRPPGAGTIGTSLPGLGADRPCLCSLLVFTARAWAARNDLLGQLQRRRVDLLCQHRRQRRRQPQRRGRGISNPEGMAYDSVTNRLFVSEPRRASRRPDQRRLPRRQGRLRLQRSRCADGRTGRRDHRSGDEDDLLDQRHGPTGTISWARLDGSIGGVLEHDRRDHRLRLSDRPRSDRQARVLGEQ